MTINKLLGQSVVKRAEFRDRAKISRSTEWRLGQENKLPCLVVVGGKTLGYLSASVEKWFEENTQRYDGVKS